MTKRMPTLAAMPGIFDDVTLEEIGPEVAEASLRAPGPHQRDIRSDTLFRYIDLMLAGEWHQSPESALVYDAVGRLVNGQHRLMAVLITRKPQVFPIIRRKE